MTALLSGHMPLLSALLLAASAGCIVLALVLLPLSRIRMQNQEIQRLLKENAAQALTIVKQQAEYDSMQVKLDRVTELLQQRTALFTEMRAGIAAADALLQRLMLLFGELQQGQTTILQRLDHLNTRKGKVHMSTIPAGPVSREQSELVKETLPVPSTSIPTTVVIDWIDATNNVSVQILRNLDRYVYNQSAAPAAPAFLPEGQCVNNGLMSLVRDSGLRTSYQYLELTTTSSVFQDGAYGVYYYDQNKVLLEVAGFQVYQGIPFDNFGFPYFKLVPSLSDIASVVPPADAIGVAMVVKLMDNTTVSLHQKPNTPGLAFHKILNP